MTSGEVDNVNTSDIHETRKGPDQLLLKFVEDAKSTTSIRLSTGRHQTFPLLVYRNLL